MKLSPYIESIEWAYQNLVLEVNLAFSHHEYSFTYQPRRPAHVLPRELSHQRPPQFAPNYNPSASEPLFASKEKLVLLVAVQASYHDLITPLTPDILPVIVDSGASISISPYDMDFIGKIHPVQNITLKGIVSGLKVVGIGTLQYCFLNNKEESRW